MEQSASMSVSGSAVCPQSLRTDHRRFLVTRLNDGSGAYGCRVESGHTLTCTLFPNRAEDINRATHATSGVDPYTDLSGGNLILLEKGKKPAVKRVWRA